MEILRTSDNKILRTASLGIIRKAIPPDFTTINYGLLYNWFAVNDSKNIAASGWHVMSNTEWIALNTYVGGTSVAGGKLKETGETYWKTPNTGADNSFSFNGRGHGIRAVSGLFGSITLFGYLWTSSEFGAYGYIVPLIYNSAAANTNSVQDKYYGNAVRLVKDSGTATTYTGNDGKIYRCVTINGITYTADNLAETLYSDGSSIPEVTDNTTWAGLTTGARCFYNNDSNNM